MEEEIRRLKKEKGLEVSYLLDDRNHTLHGLSTLSCGMLEDTAVYKSPIHPMLMDWVGKFREVPSSASWAFLISLGHGW